MSVLSGEVQHGIINAEWHHSDIKGIWRHYSLYSPGPFFYQVMPFGELYIGLLSLVIDLTVYCWLVSGAYKALNQPARRRAGVKTPARPKRARRSGAVSKQSR